MRPDHIGDVLLTAPAVGVLRASLPGAQLTYLVGPWSLEAAQHGPPVDRLRSFAFPGFARQANANPIAPYVTLAAVAARLRRERFDLAVVLRPDHWWGALLALAAGIPIRVGGRTPETQLLLTHACAMGSRQPWAEQALSTAQLALRACGVTEVEPARTPVFRVSPTARASVADLWERSGLTGQGRQVIAIQPSAGARLKSWPIERWAALADRLANQHGLSVLLCGGPDDGQLLRAIQAHMATLPAAVACGQSLDESAAMFERCAALVGLDGGAAHLAAAVGTPTVRLYGPVPTEVFGPWPPDERATQRVVVTDRLACVPCGDLEAPPCGATSLPACMLALGVDDVLVAVRALTKQTV
jgi:heptosyltransferase-2/heptosyltransferase-3